MCSSYFRVTQAKLAIFLHPCKQFSKKMQKRAGKPRARGFSAPPRAQLKLRCRRRKSAPAQRRATPRGPSAQLEGQGRRPAARLPPRHRTQSGRGGRALPRSSASADPEASLEATATEPPRGGRVSAHSCGPSKSSERVQKGSARAGGRHSRGRFRCGEPCGGGGG